MLDLSQARAALTQKLMNPPINEQQVQLLLDGVKGTTFAGITTVTQVKTAAANKHRLVQKVTVAQVQLFNSIQDARNVYTAAVKRSAGKLNNDPQNIEDFEASSNYFEHTSCFSIVRHRAQAKFYLWTIYNSADSQLFIDGTPASKQEVAALLTPAAAEALLNPRATTVNKTNDVEHAVVVRTIAMMSIVEIRCQRQQLTV